jgi:lysophospholipase L1-like esterase
VLAAVGAVAVLAVALVVVALNVTRAPASTYVQPSQADVVEPVKPPLAMFFGDSYTHGTGSSSDALRWTSLVATAMGWRENNLGRGRTGYAATSDVTGCGLAFCPNVVQMIGESTGSADVIVIAGGQNDLLNAAKEPEAQLASVAKAYSDARAKYPAATIVAVGPSTPGKVDATVRALDQAVQDAAATVGAKYISLIEPEVIDHATMMAPDGGHVNDSGHAAIAERVLSALR